MRWMCQTAPSKVISITRIMPCSIESSWDIMVLSDEIYRQLQFEGKQLSIMQVPGMKDRQDDSAGWLFKEVRNDRLRMGFGVMLGSTNGAPHGKFQFLHCEFHSTGRHRLMNCAMLRN